MYYILDIDREQDKDIIIKGTIYDAAGEVVPAIFDSGETVNDKIKSPLTIIVNEKDTTHGNLTDKLSGSVADAGFPLMITNKAKSLFEKHGIKNTEYFPLHIKGKKENSTEYYLTNIIGKIDCIDDSNSVIEYKRNGNVGDVEKLVLDESKIPNDTQIFLLGKFTLAKFVVSGNLKEAINDANLTGFVFIPVDEFTK